MIDLDKIKQSVGMIGDSDQIVEILTLIGQIASTDISVLITGDSGSGKEMVAKAIHKNSKRKFESLIIVNCAAIPSGILESELFGHKKGSFTGADKSRAGRCEQSSGGTLFLDEIGDMPLDSQTRLLRVLSNKEFYRVGGDKPIKVDVRIIAATHQNLNNLVSQKNFREDLFYRLNVIKVYLPFYPLMEEHQP
jgi:two-component system nitrogen regulation response regulator GlnG